MQGGSGNKGKAESHAKQCVHRHGNKKSRLPAAREEKAIETKVRQAGKQEIRRSLRED